MIIIGGPEEAELILIHTKRSGAKAKEREMGRRRPKGSKLKRKSLNDGRVNLIHASQFAAQREERICAGDEQTKEQHSHLPLAFKVKVSTPSHRSSRLEIAGSVAARREPEFRVKQVSEMRLLLLECCSLLCRRRCRVVCVVLRGSARRRKEREYVSGVLATNAR